MGPMFAQCTSTTYKADLYESISEGTTRIICSVCKILLTICKILLTSGKFTSGAHALTDWPNVPFV